MFVIDIIERFLKEYGYDGLYNPTEDCGCELGDLAPCGDMCIYCCMPAYKLSTPEHSSCNFIMFPSKEEIELEKIHSIFNKKIKE